MAKERKNINLKILDEMPEAADFIKKWRIRFKYTCPRTKEVIPVERRFTGTVQGARQYRNHLKYHLKGGRDPDDHRMLLEADGIDPDNPAHQPKVTGRGRGGAPTAKTDREHVTFNEIRDTHRRHREMEVNSERTLTTENNALKNRILPEIGGWVVQRVTLRDFQDPRLKWYHRHVDVPKDDDNRRSPATVNKWIRIMKGFVKWCCRRVGVAHAARDLKSLSGPKKKQGRAMSRDELDTLLKAMKDRYPHYHALCYMAAYTGQRFSTLTHLKWSDIDPENGLIKFTKTKTVHTPTVPLDHFRDVLKAHKEAMQDWSPKAFKESPFVFPKMDGELREGSSALISALRRVCEQIKIPRVTMHDFRRTFVTIALDSGVAPDVIKSLTGHSQRMIGHYHHQSAEGKNALIGTVMGIDGVANDVSTKGVVTASDVL